MPANNSADGITLEGVVQSMRLEEEGGGGKKKEVHVASDVVHKKSFYTFCT